MMDPITELLAEMRAATTNFNRQPEPDHYVWGTVVTAFPDPYTVRFDTQSTAHPVIAPDPCRPGDRVLCLRMGRQTIISQVITRPWRVPNLLNNWSTGSYTPGTGHRGVSYRRLGDTVQFRGVVNGSPTGGLTANILRVDTDCRPSGLAVMSGGWGVENRDIRVETDGYVHLSAGSFSSTWTAFDGVSYSVV